jgi:hypothetical protein
VNTSSFYFNTAEETSSAVGVTDNGSISLTSCTLAGNASPSGGALGIATPGASISLDRTIVAFTTEGTAASGEPGFTLTCCDVFGNAGGDYVGPLAGMVGTDNNICENPWFCDTPSQDYHIADYSACAPEHSGCGELIGAWPVGCSTVDISNHRQPPLTRRLAQNYPNPFNPVTTITYALPEASVVTLRIHDVAGRLVRELQPATLAGSGQHELHWDGRDDGGQAVSSGIYYYRIDASDWSETRPMVLVR